MNTDTILIRASSAGKLMVDPKNKTELLSETTKDYMLELFIAEKYGRREVISNKYTTKGKVREEDSITIVSRHLKKMFKKNDVRLSNDYITGEVDIFEGESIEKATHTIDTKSSWSLNTFLKSKKSLDKIYYYQGQCYMDLTGAAKHTVAFCLNNSTEQVIIDEKRKLAYTMNIIDPANKENEEYANLCKQIEINHIFDIQSFMNEYPWFDFENDVNNWQWDIPLEERIHTYTFEKDEEAISKLYKRVLDCREYLKTL